MNSTHLKTLPLKLLQPEIVDSELCRRDFLSFVREAWPVIEPGVQYQHNWHIELICDYLQQVFRGEITRLVINVPYRSMKSTLCSVMFPAWVWINDRSKQFLTGSHKEDLAVRDAVKTRRLIQSRWFQDRWGDEIVFTSDQNQKRRYEISGTGQRIIFGMSGGISGEGGDIMIIDDPHDAKKAMYSEAERLGALDTFDNSLSTRLNDPKKSAIIIIQQRVHQDDLTGHVIAKGNGDWIHVRIPFKYEMQDAMEEDPRKEEGEFYWGDRFGETFYEEAQRFLGSYGVACQLQQRPAPLEGAIVEMQWFKRYQYLPEKGQWVMLIQAWDTSQKADELTNAPWVCGTWLITYHEYYLVDVFRDWLNYPAGKKALIAQVNKCQLLLGNKPNAIVIEDKSTGSSLLQEAEGLPVIAFEPESDKVTRLATESPAIEAGMVYLPNEAPWLTEFELEMQNFPNTAYKDQADMVSMALKYLRENIGIQWEGGFGIGRTVASGADW